MGLHPDGVVELYRSKGWFSGLRWGDLLDEHASARPDACAIVDPPDRSKVTDGEPGRWTWLELADAASAMAEVLVAHGVGRGDVVGVQLANVKELAQVYLGIAKVGAIASPFPVQFRQHELAQLAEVTEMRAFVTSARLKERRTAESLEEVRKVVPSIRDVFAFGSDLGPGWIVLDEELPAAAGRRPSYDPAAVDANDCMTICWTSGTEAVPKGIPRTHEDFLAISYGEVDATRIVDSTVLLSPFPMVNMAGIGGTFVPWLITGSKLVLHHPFDMDLLLSQIPAEQVTFALAGPAHLTALAQDTDRLDAVDLSSLRMIGTGSAPIPEHTVSTWEGRYGIEIVNLYGSNEGVGLINSRSTVPDPAKRATWFPRWGRPEVDWPGVRTAEWMETRLVDPETEEEVLEPGVAGELRTKGPTIFSGYLPAQDLQSPFDADGYCRSGDQFMIAGDHDEYYVYVDRLKDIIIRGGFNISAAEIENLVMSHPSVSEAAAVGYHDTVLGERTCVYVVPEVGAVPDLATICAYLAERQVASYKHPERLEVVDQLPRNPLNKVVKDELRKDLAQRMDSERAEATT